MPADLDDLERHARAILALVEEVRRLRAARDHDDSGSWATRSAQLRALAGVTRKS